MGSPQINFMKKISVAMTTYCGEQFVVEQLQSLLNQSIKPDEVVICDDCSQDSTVVLVQEFIHQYSLENWKLYINECNMGYVENYKKAMKLTTGDIVFLCDQDDIWCSDKIQLMVDQMEQNPRILALASNYRLVDQCGEYLETNVRRVRKRIANPDATIVAERVTQGSVLYSNIAQGCTCAYRREVLSEYCQTSSRVLPHDWAVNMLAYRDRGLYFVNRELTLYRLHENNTIGFPSYRQKVQERSARLRKYMECIQDSKNLPLGKASINELENIAAFTSVRIAWLENKKIRIWLYGVVHHFSIMMRYFFLSYIKDLVLVLGRRNSCK